MAQPQAPLPEACPDELSVAIVGAGFSGLCMGIKLKLAGDTSFAIFDAADDIGGTWRDNVYPGCACDIASPLYSFSFAQWPRWSQLYSPQPEIWQYQKMVLEQYRLKPFLRLGTCIAAAAFDEGAGVWHLRSAAGEEFVARAVVLAVGGLSVPTTPSIPGLPSFKGSTFHSAAWDPSCDLTNKRVAVVGTGASAIQIIPAIQPLVGQLFVFQRTPGWVVPRDNYKFSPERQRSWWWPLWMRLNRLWLFLFNELVVGRAMVTNNKRIQDEFAARSLAKLRQQVPDEGLRQKLTPQYAIGCKRVLLSDDYYPAVSQPNVQLIASGLAQVKDGSTLVAQDGTEVHDVDAIIFSTGFDVASATSKIDIRGLGGASLADIWGSQGGPKAYLGTATAGFPNLFQLGGPNTGLGHNSIIFMSECQVDYVMRVLAWMRAARLKRVSIKAAAQEVFDREMQQRLKRTVWLSGGCQSWYLDASRGGSHVLWPGLCMEYWWRTLWVRKGDWEWEAEGEGGSAEEGQKKKAV